MANDKLLKTQMLKFLDISIERNELTFELVKSLSPASIELLNEAAEAKGKDKLPASAATVQNHIKRLKALKLAILKQGISEEKTIQIMKRNNPSLDGHMAYENFKAFIKQPPSKVIPALTGART